jgi:hypothetical protein
MEKIKSDPDAIATSLKTTKTPAPNIEANPIATAPSKPVCCLGVSWEEFVD